MRDLLAFSDSKTKNKLKSRIISYISNILRIDIAKITADSAEISAIWSQSANPSLFEELHLTGDLSLRLLASKEDERKTLFTGTLSGTQVLTCARTLEPFERAFSTEVAIEMERMAISSQEFDDEDPEVFCLRVPIAQEYLDVSECIRQLVILQEPMYPVKDPDAEFFFEQKPSNASESDPRWDKLKALARNMKKEEQE